MEVATSGQRGCASATQRYPPRTGTRMRTHTQTWARTRDQHMLARVCCRLERESVDAATAGWAARREEAVAQAAAARTPTAAWASVGQARLGAQGGSNRGDTGSESSSVRGVDGGDHSDDSSGDGCCNNAIGDDVSAATSMQLTNAAAVGTVGLEDGPAQDAEPPARAEGEEPRHCHAQAPSQPSTLGPLDPPGGHSAPPQVSVVQGTGDSAAATAVVSMGSATSAVLAMTTPLLQPRSLRPEWRGVAYNDVTNQYAPLPAHIS